MQHLLDVSLFSSMIRMVAPILLAALGGAICSRVGLFNVGLEGFVLVGAFSAIVGNFTQEMFWQLFLLLLPPRCSFH